MNPSEVARLPQGFMLKCQSKGCENTRAIEALCRHPLDDTLICRECLLWWCLEKCGHGGGEEDATSS